MVLLNPDAKFPQKRAVTLMNRDEKVWTEKDVEITKLRPLTLANQMLEDGE